ncbi:MAG: hypothetical protein JSS51_03970 [Planctomycetes bacterium]|nr:hypothetical protein [Planctomycetota bacterium]
MSGFSHPNQTVREILGRSALTVEDLKGTLTPPTTRTLSAIFPPQRTYQCGFDKITVPSGLSAPAAGNCYVYGLRRWTIGPDIAAEGVLLGAFFQMMPTDYNGLGWASSAASASAWGDVRGAKAAIVVGYNWKQMNPGAFSVIRTPFPGIEAGGFGASSQAPDENFLFTIGFPPGSFGDTLPQKLYAIRALAPAAQRLKRGATLDVGLLLNGAQVAAASSGSPKSIEGLAHVQLHVGQLTQEIDLSS